MSRIECYTRWVWSAACILIYGMSKPASATHQSHGWHAPAEEVCTLIKPKEGSPFNHCASNGCGSCFAFNPTMNTHTILVLFSTITLVYGTALSLLEPVIENVVHLQTALPPPETPGLWRKKMIWKARWVKEWKSAKTWRPVWRKVWSPIEIREWVPIPKPPPNFHEDSHDGPPPHIEHSVDPSSEYGPPNLSGFPGPTPPGPSGPPQGPSARPPNNVYGPPSSQNGPTPGPPQGPPPFRPMGPPNNVYGPPSSLNGPTPGPPQGPPPFRPVGPPNNVYGPPSAQNLRPSTQLHPIEDTSAWPVPDMQELLTSYQTIREPGAETQNSNYHIDSPNPEKLSRFFEPPTKQREEFYSNFSSPLTKDFSKESKNSVSPYAAKLAQAVLREKFNQSLNPTERPSGLTDVIYNSDQSGTTAGPNRVTKATSVTSTENPNVYIVTPLSFG